MSWSALCHVVTIVFIALKLGGAITWSWWIVLFPSLLIFGIAGILFLAAGFLFALASKLNKK